MSEKRALVEAALFMSENPLTIGTLSRISGTPKRALEKILDQIKEEFDLSHHGMKLILTQEGYKFQVKERFLNKVSDLTPHSDLSEGLLRTLSLVALRQPITQAGIVKIQGNKAYNYVKSLEKRGLINAEKAGRTKLLTTTREFERYFGKSLNEIRERLKSEISSEEDKRARTALLDEEVEGIKVLEDKEG